MRKLADTPIWLRLTGAIWLMLIIAWGGMIAGDPGQSGTAIDQARISPIHEKRPWRSDRNDDHRNGRAARGLSRPDQALSVIKDLW
jgi:hypothetical protein